MNIPKEYLIINRIRIPDTEETGWRVGTDLWKPGTPEVLEAALNKLGEDGWTLCGTFNDREPILTRIKTDDGSDGPMYLGSGDADGE